MSPAFAIAAGLAGLLAALYLAVTRGARLLFGTRRRLEAELGLEVLDDRLRRGEITPGEHARARRALGFEDRSNR